jgi:hypothetical protein
MPATSKVLGQAAPGSDSLTDLYIASAGSETVISSVVIANRSSSASAFYRLAITPNGETLANKHYLAFDTVIAPADSAILSLGLTVDAADKILVYASTSNLSFNLFGVEFS